MENIAALKQELEVVLKTKCAAHWLKVIHAASPGRPSAERSGSG
jgi:hypothetical protein